MVVLPIGSYYLSLAYYFGGSRASLVSRAAPLTPCPPIEKNTTGAGITAAVMANVLLFSFVWYAMAEDRADAKREALKKKQ